MKLESWLYEGNSLYVLNQIDKPIRLTITSPPYFLSKGRQNSMYGNHPHDIENSPSYEEYINSLVTVFSKVYDITLAGGFLAIIIDDVHVSPKISGELYSFVLPTHAHLICSLTNIGWLYKGAIIWKKARNFHAAGGALQLLGSFPYPPNIPVIHQYEFILTFQKRGKTKLPPNDIREKSKIDKQSFNQWASNGIWEINGEYDPNHPAPFPIEIPKRLIQMHSFVGDWILDPFMGRGTVGIAAILLQRNFVGIDIYDYYVSIAEKAINEYTTNLFSNVQCSIRRIKIDEYKLRENESMNEHEKYSSPPSTEGKIETTEP